MKQPKDEFDRDLLYSPITRRYSHYGSMESILTFILHIVLFVSIMGFIIYAHNA